MFFVKFYWHKRLFLDPAIVGLYIIDWEVNDKNIQYIKTCYLCSYKSYKHKLCSSSQTSVLISL